MMTRPITLAALWGNSDAESEINISRKEWNRICRGGELTRRAKACYEGKWFSVTWQIKDRWVLVDCDEGGVYQDGPLEDLFDIRDDNGEELPVPPIENVPELPPRPSDVFSGSSVRRRHRDQVVAIIKRSATSCSSRAVGNMVTSHEEVTWSIPCGSAVWTQGRWGRPETLVVDPVEARARILLEMGVDLAGSPTYMRLR